MVGMEESISKAAEMKTCYGRVPSSLLLPPFCPFSTEPPLAGDEVDESGANGEQKGAHQGGAYHFADVPRDQTGEGLCAADVRREYLLNDIDDASDPSAPHCGPVFAPRSSRRGGFAASIGTVSHC